MFMNILFVHLNVLLTTMLFYFNCKHFLFVYIVKQKQTKNFTDFIKKIVDSLGSREVPHTIWARLVLPFWRLLDTNKQTEKQSIYIHLYVSILCLFMLYMFPYCVCLCCICFHIVFFYVVYGRGWRWPIHFLNKDCKKSVQIPYKAKFKNLQHQTRWVAVIFFIISDPPWRINLTPSWYNDQYSSRST